jgi:hypothetical protein
VASANENGDLPFHSLCKRLASRIRRDIGGFAEDTWNRVRRAQGYSTPGASRKLPPRPPCAWWVEIRHEDGWIGFVRHGGGFPPQKARTLPKHNIAHGSVSLRLATIVRVVFVGLFYPETLKSFIFSRMIDMDLLIVLSTSASYIFSVISFGYLVGHPATINRRVLRDKHSVDDAHHGWLLCWCLGSPGGRSVHIDSVSPDFKCHLGDQRWPRDGNRK